MNILFLDLSTQSTGYAIGDETGKLVTYGCITARSTNYLKRIDTINKELKTLAKQYNIKKIIAEDVRTDYKNAHTYRLLTWLQAIVVYTLFLNDPAIEYEFIQPSSWRSKIGIHTGRGIKREELKKADIAYVKNKYDIDANDDVCDAICILDSYYTSDTPW